MNWLQASEINFALIVKGKKPYQAYSPSDFEYPYSDMMEYIQRHPEFSKEDLYSNFAPQPIDSALHSIQSLNGSADRDWHSILQSKALDFEKGCYLEKRGKDLKEGREIDKLELATEIKALEWNETAGVLMNAADIDLDAVKHLQPSGWEVFDLAFGGMPVTGLLTVLAPTKTGKSFWTSKFVYEHLNYYREKTAMIFCQEMPEDRFLKRSVEMYDEILPIIKQRRITITRKARSIEKMISLVAQHTPDLVVIDGMDTLYEDDDGQASTAKAEAVWKKAIEMGVLLKVPIVVTVQPNRSGKLAANDGKFINHYYIERTGAAENASEQAFVLQYLPKNASFNWQDKSYPVMDDHYYMIATLQRNNERLGAILMENSDKMWCGNVHGTMKDGKRIPTLYRKGAGANLGKRKGK